MLDYLDDIASDLSVFHQIKEAGEMEAAVFFSLVFRLPAYTGALAARIANEDRQAGPVQPSAGQGRRVPDRYERDSGLANNPAVATSAPPLTAATMAGLNAQLGGRWFSHAAVS